MLSSATPAATGLPSLLASLGWPPASASLLAGDRRSSAATAAAADGALPPWGVARAAPLFAPAAGLCAPRDSPRSCTVAGSGGKPDICISCGQDAKGQQQQQQQQASTITRTHLLETGEEHVIEALASGEALAGVHVEQGAEEVEAGARQLGLVLLRDRLRPLYLGQASPAKPARRYREQGH